MPPVNLPSTRERLLEAAQALFARSGYAATPVREICNLARANPGAVSYHFGGKRQLYRAVLRRAAEGLAAAVTVSPEPREPAPRTHVVAALARACRNDPAPFRLLLRDLADGGDGAVEALAPLLRTAAEPLGAASGGEPDPEARRAAIEELLRAAAPAFLLLAAWPVLARAFDLPEDSLDSWLHRLLPRGE